MVKTTADLRSPERVLLIEDSELDAKIMGRYLSRSCGPDMRLTHVQTLGDARARLALGDFDLIVLDLDLPDGAGLESLQTIRPDAGDIPVIVATGVDEPEVGVQAVALGAQDFLVKDRMSEDDVARAVSFSVARRTADDAGSGAAHHADPKLLHAFNNLLAVMLGNASLALERTKDPEAMARHVKSLMRGAEDASKLVKRLRAASEEAHAGSLTPENLPVADAPRCAHHVLTARFGYRRTST